MEREMSCFVFRTIGLTTMQLMMYIGNDHIESVRLDPDRISKPGYLGTFKRNLKVKYRELISQHGSPADFLVVDVTPKSQESFQQPHRL